MLLLILVLVLVLVLASRQKTTFVQLCWHKMENMAAVWMGNGVLLYSNKMKLHCFQLANNLNRILTFYYYFISKHTKAGGRQKDTQGPQGSCFYAFCQQLGVF